MSKVKTSKGAVWEDFRAWHVCKTQHARSQMTEVSVEVTCHKIMTNHWVYQELDIGMRHWNNAHSLLFSISPQPPRSLQATSCNLLSSLSLSLEQAIQNGVFNFLPTWQKIGKNGKKIGVPIYCWHTLIVWLMGLSISELVDKWTLKKWITGFVAGPSGSSVVQHYPWGKSISSRSVLDNPIALSTE